MARKVYSVVPRITRTASPILFFPEQVGRGMVTVYEKIGQHGSASPFYFYDTRPPRTVAEWRACLDLIEEERTLPPEAEQLEARIVTRLR